MSKHDRQNLPLQVRATRDYAAKHRWMIDLKIKEVARATQRRLRERLLDAARRHVIDVVLVWRLDRWGRSAADLSTTLKELSNLGVGFVSLTEPLDWATPAGQAMARLLALLAGFEYEIRCERVPRRNDSSTATGKAFGAGEVSCA